MFVCAGKGVVAVAHINRDVDNSDDDDGGGTGGDEDVVVDCCDNAFRVIGEGR